MNGSWNIFGIILLLSFFRFQVVRAQALALVVNADKITYVPAGATLELNVSYTYSGTKTVIVQWNFNGSGIVGKSGNDPPQGSNSRATIRGKASLVLNNTILSDNGTYSVSVQPLGEAQKESSFQVIIEEKPNATTNCSQTSLNEGADITCLCYSTSGNPPPIASWLKDSKMIGDVGYMKKELLLKKVTKKDSGTYVCQVRSHNLIDDKSVQVIVKYPPKITSFKIKIDNTVEEKTDNTVEEGKTITLICEADSVPPSNYSIGFNDSNPEQVTGGMKEIKTVALNNSGTYICVAENILGSDNQTLFVNVKGETLKPSTVMPENTNSSSDPPVSSSPGNAKGGGGLGPGAIAGIVIGILLVIVVAVVLVYCFYFKNPNDQGICGCTKKEDIGGDQVVNHGVGAYDQPSKAENPYESVDGEKTNSDQQAGPSGDTSPPPAGSSGLPPVYAVVDKNKKTKKPPPKSQPPSVTYASLDPVDLQPDSSKMRDRSREETNYADIDLGKLQSDLV